MIGIGIGMTPAQARGWTPLALGAALFEWWTADEGLTLVSGAVSAWTGRKMGRTVTQAVGAARPAFSATGFNGRACLIHDGIDDCLYSVAATDWFPTGNAGMEMYGVGQQDAPAASDTALRCFAALGNSAFNADMRQRRQEVSGFNRYQITVGNGSGAASPSYAGVNFDGRNLIFGRAESGQVLYSIDGNVPASAVNAKSVTAEQFAIGSLPNGSSQYWWGRSRHVVVTDLLSAEQRALLTTFLLAERAL